MQKWWKKKKIIKDYDENIFKFRQLEKRAVLLGDNFYFIWKIKIKYSQFFSIPLDIS